MDGKTQLDGYNDVLKMAEQGDYQRAFDAMQIFLQQNRDNAEILNDAGAILHCLGRNDEAISHFKKADTIKPNSAEIIYNLAEAFLAGGKAESASQLFGQMQRLGILNPDLINRTAAALLDNDNRACAIETLLLSLSVWPNQQVLEPMLDVIKSKRPKIAFFCGADGDTFVKDIIKFSQDRFNIRIFNGKTEDQLYELMQWSDISWFEWCTNLAAIGSNKPKVCKTIVRLHRYEAYSDWPEKINWQNIDRLVTIGNAVTDKMLKTKVPNLEQMTEITHVANGVDTEKFRFVDKRKGKNIAFLANSRMVKNPAFLIQCMQKLNYIDKEYKLFIAGSFYEPELEQYIRHMIAELKLTDCVFIEPWQKDVFAWLSDKHYIVSTSIVEGQPVSILEAMACGLKPVIHNWPGAEGVFGKEFLFNIAEEFCEQILSDNYQSQKYREFVENNFSLQRQLGQVNQLFCDFEKQLSAGDIQNQQQDLSGNLSCVTENSFTSKKVNV